MNTNTEKDVVRHAFLCDGAGCETHHGHKRVGVAYATALSGFAAGAIISLIVLYPWLVFLGKLCPVGRQ